MSKSLDLDDIEQMYADILNDNSDIINGFEDKTRAPTKPEALVGLNHSETPTPAEPLEFVASPIEETAKVLKTASRSASRSTSRSRSHSRSRSTSTANLRRKSSNVEDLAIDMPAELRKALETPPQRGRQMPELTISTPTRRSSARLEKLAKEGTKDEIKRERDSTSLGILSPNSAKDPEQAMVDAIRRASSRASHAGSRATSRSRSRDSNAILDTSGPSKPSLHRRVSSNVIVETDELSVRPMIMRSTSSQRTQQLESLAHKGDHEAIRRERDSTSLGVLSPNKSADPEQAIEEAIRRASSRQSSRRSSQLEALARDGTAQEIREARESTSEGVLNPNLEPNPEDSMAKAIRRASESRDRPASVTAARRRSSRLSESGSPKVSEKTANSSPSKPTPTLNIPSTPTKRRPSEIMESISKNGSPAQIRAERESTSEGILSPNLAANPEDAIANAFRRASSSSHKRSASVASATSTTSAAELEQIANSGDKQEIIAERESTSEGVPDPTESADAEKAIEAALRRSSNDSDERERMSVESPRHSSVAEPSVPTISDEPQVGSLDIIEEAPQTPQNSIADTPSKPTTAALGGIPKRDLDVPITPDVGFNEDTHVLPAPENTRVAEVDPADPVPFGEAEEEKTEEKTARDLKISTDSKSDSKHGLVNEDETHLKPTEDELKPEELKETIVKPDSSTDVKEVSNPVDDEPQETNEVETEATPKVDITETKAKTETKTEGLDNETEPKDEIETKELVTESETEIKETSKSVPDEVEHVAISETATVSEPKKVEEVEDPKFKATELEGTDEKDTEPAEPLTAGSIAESVEIKKGLENLKLESESGEPSKSTEPSDPTSPAEINGIEVPKVSKSVEKTSSTSSKLDPIEPKGIEESPSTTSSSPTDLKSEDLTPLSGASPAPMLVETTPTPEPEESEKQAEIKKEPVPPTPTPKAAESESKNVTSATKSEHEVVYLYVSMASGGRGAMQNFQKAQTILQTYNVEFTPVEISMDDKARRIWKYRGIAKNKKLPAVVRDGEIKLDFDELLAANEDEEVDEIIFEEF